MLGECDLSMSQAHSGATGAAAAYAEVFTGGCGGSGSDLSASAELLSFFEGLPRTLCWGGQ